MFKNFLNRLLNSRLWALATKEVNQIIRNKQLIFLLVFPPTIQLLVYGFALNPEVHFLKLGVVDYANSIRSHELVSALTENRIFITQDYLFSEQALGEQVQQGQITAGLIIPPEFDRQLAESQTADVQVLIDGVDANTAGIAAGYISQITNQFSRRLSPEVMTEVINPQVTFLYNPGLDSSWFFIPGVTGVVLTLTSVLVSSSTVVREKDTGTLEQLLITPAEAWEILVAKIVPLFVLLMADIFLALAVGEVVFQVPFRGSFPLFLLISALYIFVGIGLGILLATISRNQRQVVLTSFFINLPLIQLSGAIAPIESMPLIFQHLSWLNPLRHYVAVIRGFLLKGVGVVELWQHVLALGAIAVILMAVSIKKFRTQLS
ncbi:ABC transporter permease [Oscillatoria sp. FACHB-1407]|uniref:ABC transporter permease n=1 Tax=Oscillatoria sp. FACHB-1407 TaxID=2692847 RepID=UPI0016832B5E|nr:ABC transporter permease [Oscillatoria sp. FACHB-1407]MBD2461107.1 ABC transporter permease [Oscillatoria sp. FACHB-1407]